MNSCPGNKYKCLDRLKKGCGNGDSEFNGASLCGAITALCVCVCTASVCVCVLRVCVLRVLRQGTVLVTWQLLSWGQL